MAKHILAALVENRPGVLARVANLFRRRSFNIDSLSVGRTQRDEMSRMTIVMESDSAEADRLVKNLYKLVDVVHVEAGGRWQILTGPARQVATGGQQVLVDVDVAGEGRSNRLV